MAETNVLLAAARAFADAVATKSATGQAASAEAQLGAPFENLLAAVAAGFGIDATCTGEPALPNRLGRPDYAVSVGGALAGYVELKAPGTGAEARRFRGRNRDQFKRFSAIPNILYGDGGEWALYRGGERVGGVVKLAGDVRAGANAVREDGAQELGALFRKFLSWEPILPRDARGGIDLKAFAALLAPLARLLRDDVKEALGNGSALSLLAQDWRQLLFPDATDAQFADAYAQTVTFALLLGRAEGADPLTLEGAQETLAARHGLLSRALQVLTDPNARSDMAASLALLQRVLAVVPPALFDAVRDPWLYFYEDFLAAYDPALRKDAGVYYTPVEVVGAQVRLVDDLLANQLGKPLGFADEGVTTLDPAVGTGTYLLGIVEHALARVAETRGAGAVASHAATLAGNLHGFERLVGAYAVSELRVSRALQQRGAGGERANVYLTDTLESPHAAPRQLPLFMRPIAEQHRLALEVKRRTPMLVCLGNPPYDRHEAARSDNGHRTGAWVRWGEDGGGADAIFRDFAAPVIAARRGGQLKNLYNLYVYFWRWALWKVFEQDEARGGVVSFVTASSYLAGDAFLGMREHMRRVCDEVWILDLGGEGRGARLSENVFAIQTPVAVAVAMRRGRANPDEPATVRYARIDGSRAEKLARLDGIRAFGDVAWRDCPEDWHAPFLPPGAGDYFGLPLLTDLMPWQHSGVQLKRTWPIAPDSETLRQRWRALLRTKGRAEAFRETTDRAVTGRYRAALSESAAEDETPIAELPADANTPAIHRYAYRALDRQHVLADGRLISRPRPDLWRSHSDRQIYLTSLLTKPLGSGPALVACADMPDLDHFSGRGAKDVIPLYRAADGSEANVAPGLLGQLPLANATAEDFLAYIYGILAHPAFAERFAGELESRQLRVPITADARLFRRVRNVGRRLLKLHTYHRRFLDQDDPPAVPPGAARCTKGVPLDEDGYPAAFSHDAAARTLRVGEGEFAPVPVDVYEFEVSGLKAVQSWLRYRMKRGAGRQSSPLNDIRPNRWPPAFTTELLELLWVVEGTLALYPEQARLLERVVAGPCLPATATASVDDALRRPPKAPRAAPLLGA